MYIGRTSDKGNAVSKAKPNGVVDEVGGKIKDRSDQNARRVDVSRGFENGVERGRSWGDGDDGSLRGTGDRTKRSREESDRPVEGPAVRFFLRKYPVSEHGHMRTQTVPQTNTGGQVDFDPGG